MKMAFYQAVCIILWPVFSYRYPYIGTKGRKDYMVVKEKSTSALIERSTSKRPAPLWLDVSQAAQRVNKTPRFIRRLIAERRLRYYKHGGLIAILESDLDAWAMSEPHEPMR